MRRLLTFVIALALTALVCMPMIPNTTEAQESNNLVIVKTDYQMLGLTELSGGGHLTYELRGQAAGDLRRAIMAVYDWDNSGTIESGELRFNGDEGYIMDIEDYLEEYMNSFFGGLTNAFAPLHRDQDIEVDAQGIMDVDSTEVVNDNSTIIRITLFFDAYNSNSPDDFRMVSNIFFEALYYDLMQSPSYGGELHFEDYVYQYKHTDFRVSGGNFQNLEVDYGKIQVYRTPAGEVVTYSVTFYYNDDITDQASFRPFSILENPQILFAVVFICSYLMSTMPTRMYANYKFAYPRKFRHKALKIKWLHITSKLMILVLLLFYFFPCMFGFISPNIFLSGAVIWILSITFAIIFSVLAKVLYDKKLEELSKEQLATPERRPVARPPEHVTRTPAGVNVVVQQQPQAPAKERPTGPPCVVCKKPITDYVDLKKCKCGQLYHETCAEVARHCTKCGAALVEIIPEGPVKVEVKCPTCGKSNQVEEGLDLLMVKCSACGIILEKVDDGYNYLIVDNEHTTAFKMFVSLMKNGCTGLSISTTFPDKLRKEHDMQKAEVIWLTDTSVADKKTINPHRLEFEMMRMYAAFVKNNPKSAIILDGFEYLVVENGFDKVFKFIKKINDLSSVNNATLIVPIGTSSLEPDQLGTLKKEFDKVIDMTGSNGDE